MSITILRFYMPLAAKLKHPKSFWQKLFGASLGRYLVRKAKEEGIKQALVQRVEAGYLSGEKLVFDQVEAIPPRLPLCVELIDDESKLRDFISKNKSELTDCRAVIFRAAEVIRVENKGGK